LKTTKTTRKMKTKTLLIAAAALAVGVISSQAQVYSQNVVGYINQTIAGNSFFPAGNVMINGSDSSQTNGSINTCYSGLVSSPNDPPYSSTNSQLYVWNGAGYVTYYYFNQADCNTWWGDTAHVAGFYTAGGDYCPAKLPAGSASFIYNNSASSTVLTTVGNVLQGTNISTIVTGYNLLSLKQPISTNVCVSGYGLPSNLTSSPNDPPTFSANDTLYLWSGNGPSASFVTYYYFNQADCNTWWGDTTHQAGFYTAGGNYAPNPAVNQGFFLYHNGAPITWTNVYQVQ